MTRENVKRQFTQYSACDPRECSKCADDALDRAVDEIVRLRAKLQAARERVDATCNCYYMPYDHRAYLLYDDVLAALDGAA